MTIASHSTVLDHPVETVWALIRDFNNYPAYIDGVTESRIEDDRRGDEVGAIRCFLYGDAWIRQRLAAHCDADHSLTYEGVEPFAFPGGLRADPPSPIGYAGTMRLSPADEAGRTRLDWSVRLDTAPGEAEPWQALFEAWIPDWADSLRRTLGRSAATPSAT
ncbi:MAG: hypothetical protein K0R83_442 [Caulobacter sp.]|jgi:hypothetical protein|nr:hypothetical protein [Caulobacter sp.]